LEQRQAVDWLDPMQIWLKAKEELVDHLSKLSDFTTKLPNPPVPAAGPTSPR